MDEPSMFNEALFSKEESDTQFHVSLTLALDEVNVQFHVPAILPLEKVLPPPHIGSIFSTNNHFVKLKTQAQTIKKCLLVKCIQISLSTLAPIFIDTFLSQLFLFS
jgi:hypothetical protein